MVCRAEKAEKDNENLRAELEKTGIDTINAAILGKDGMTFDSVEQMVVAKLHKERDELRQQLSDERTKCERIREQFELAAAIDSSTITKLEEELNWQNNRNAGYPTKGGFEFYINEEWTGLATAALDANYGWHVALRKNRIDPDDERVRVRRVIEDDNILKQLSEATNLLKELRLYWENESGSIVFPYQKILKFLK